LMIIAPLAVRIRKYLPTGYSQPEWIRYRLGETNHKLYLLVFFWYQLMAITMQLYAGGCIFSLLTGVPLESVMLVFTATTLTYGMISGMRASIITDFLQYGLIIAGGILVIPWTLALAGGLPAIAGGLGGVTGQHHSLFDAQVAFNFGIVTSLGLISGSLGDQQNWQRAFTIEKTGLVKAYVVAGILFGIVPIALSTLGFLGANPATGVTLAKGVDPAMIGVAVVAHYLPTWAVVAFIVMMLGGLCATMDSAMCAASSLFAFNCFPFSESERQIRVKELAGGSLTAEELLIQNELDRKTLKRGRLAMLGIAIVGLLVALAVLRIPGFGIKYLWWVLNSAGMCVAVPTVLSLCWNKLDSKGVFWGTMIGFLVGIPVFVYSNAVGVTWLTVATSIGIVLVSTLFCLLFQRKEPFILQPSEAVAVSHNKAAMGVAKVS
jgi:Na+/proline symporter